MKGPDFFIIGAPKCGTTSLHQYLNQHPDVFMPAQKEPHYFATDLDWVSGWGVREAGDYAALFERAREGQRIGEASTWYLYSKEAPRRVHDYRPDAKIIVMLRNPVDVIRSMHAHNVRNDNDDLADIHESLSAEADRREGRRMPPGAPFKEIVYYRDLPRYAEQLQRWVTLFGWDQVRVIIFDDFVKDTTTSYRETLQFLGVDDSFDATFEVYNAVMPKWLSKAYRGLASWPTLHKYTWEAIPVSWRQGVRSLSTRVSRSVSKQSALSAETRSTLQAEFADEIARLSKLLQRDLNHWSRPRVKR